MKFRNQLQGFTLIEVMVTVAIIAILAAIALPSYESYVRRGKVQEATSALADMRVKLEQYYQDNRKYTGYVDDNCDAASDGRHLIAAKYFTYGCVTTANAYTITA